MEVGPQQYGLDYEQEGIASIQNLGDTCNLLNPSRVGEVYDDAGRQ